MLRKILGLTIIVPAAANAASFSVDEATTLYNYNVALLDLERASGTLDGKY